MNPYFGKLTKEKDLYYFFDSTKTTESFNAILSSSSSTSTKSSAGIPNHRTTEAISTNRAAVISNNRAAVIANRREAVPTKLSSNRKAKTLQSKMTTIRVNRAAIRRNPHAVAALTPLSAAATTKKCKRVK